MKKKLFVVTANSVAKIGLQSYLSSLLGGFIEVLSVRAKDATPELLEQAQCILYSSEKVKRSLSFSVPDHIHHMICIRTFNHTFLHKIFQIPPGSMVYLVNDNEHTTYEVLRQLQEFGITQYQFIPHYPGVTPGFSDVHYAVTFGELHLVPPCATSVIDLGNRIADISTINEIIAFFHLPASLADEITRNYVNHIVQIIKLSNSQLSNALDTQHITQVIINNTEEGICLLDDLGSIKMVNHAFSSMLCLIQKNLVGSRLSSLLSDSGILIEPDKPGEYLLQNNYGQSVHLWIQEIDTLNRSHLFLLHTDFASKEAGGEAAFHGNYQIQSFSQIITQSPKVLRLLEHARRTSLGDFHLIVQGENGTEKEMLAQSIHSNSKRHDNPFITINPLSLEPSDISTLLTGREGEDMGVLERANGGTLFINGIHTMPLSSQATLLHILKEGWFYRQGGKIPVPIKVRIIASTTRDLYSMVLDGEFLDDLFFTLNCVSLQTIPLRQRKEDIPLLLNHFLKNIFNNPGLTTEQIFSETLCDFLIQYPWPGNAQEVHNICKYVSCIYSRKPVGMQDLPDYILKQIASGQPDLSLTERQVLEIIKEKPRCGRAAICQALKERQMEISDGKVRTILQLLSQKEYIKVHKTRGGCEITEKGLILL